MKEEHNSLSRNIHTSLPRVSNAQRLTRHLEASMLKLSIQDHSRLFLPRFTFTTHVTPSTDSQAKDKCSFEISLSEHEFVTRFQITRGRTTSRTLTPVTKASNFHPNVSRIASKMSFRRIAQHVKYRSLRHSENPTTSRGRIFASVLIKY